MRAYAKNIAKRLPIVGPTIRERDQLREELMGGGKLPRRSPPGHYYSPIPSLEEVRRDKERIYAVPRLIPGIDLREQQQLELLDQFQAYYDELPFRPHRTSNLRYYYENPYYLYSDAIFLNCMIQHARPRRVVEIGSGHSSCMILDSNELFFDNSIECIFIEPYPERLRSLVREGDLQRAELIEARVQDVPLSRFESLLAGDILFVDSSHVSKVGSDVNHILFEILPRLNPGVFIHFHDIFYPFEYPESWVLEGLAWNECYALRAFLQYNDRFTIILLNTFLTRFHEGRFRRDMPLCLRNTGGSLWIQKT